MVEGDFKYFIKFKNYEIRDWYIKRKNFCLEKIYKVRREVII